MPSTVDHASLRALIVIFTTGMLLLVSTSAIAHTVVGEVVGIADGDTFTLLDATKTQYKIRLAGIDEPEKRQSFGDKSKQHLASILSRRQVVVDWSKRDRYGRIVGKVLVGGEDACLAQVRAGLAWHYTAYKSEQSHVDRELYVKAEDEARQAKRGLWREESPVPPWDFRHSRKAKR